VVAPARSAPGGALSIRLMGGLHLAGSLGVLSMWILGHRWQSLSAFDSIGLAVLGGALALTGTAILAAGRLLRLARVCTLVLLFTYCQLSLLFALHGHQGAVDGAALARLSHVLALVHLVSLTLFVRRALLVPCLHAVATAVQGIAGWLLLPRLSGEVGSSLASMVLAQPVYLGALAWIHIQRQHAMAAQQSAADEKLTFVGMISHELRSPLQTIVSSIEALERRFGLLKLPKPDYKNLARIRFSAVQLESYLKDLIVVIKLETGLAEPRSEPVNLQDLVQDMVVSYEAAAADAGNSLAFHVEPSCETIRGDRVRIHQILNNLLSNAVKYTRNGDVQVVVDQPASDASRVRLRVIDSGVGISPQHMSQIWMPFVRLTGRAQRQRPVKGDGLGLAVVQLLVQRLGGSVDVSSSEGEGTTVTVYVPSASDGGADGISS